MGHFRAHHQGYRLMCHTSSAPVPSRAGKNINQSMERILHFKFSYARKNAKQSTDVMKVRLTSMSNILLVILVLLLVGVFPVWPHSAHWGYYPGGGLGLVLLIAVIFAFARPKALT